MATPKSPFQLPEEHVKRLTQEAQNIQDVRAALEAAKRAGLDVSQLEERLEYYDTLRKGLLREFGPGR